MVNVPNFVRNNTPLCICTLGIAILGYLGYHAVRWIIDKCTKTEQIDRVAQRTISSTSSQEVSPRSHHITTSSTSSKEVSPRSHHISTPQTSALPQTTAPKRPEEVQVDKIALQQQSEDQKTSAATKIQSVWRGHLARIKIEKAEKHVLSYALLKKAKPYIDVPSNRQDMPRASCGKTPVYLPKELPIVLKQSGSPQNQKRFNQMKEGRDICEKNSYEHLVIPKARVYGKFIVESRLPITMHGTKEQIGLYIENRERFTGAVQEFTGFLCQSNFRDITGGSNDPYGTLSKTPVGRYDNIALYLEEDQGKIGLIDLEQFTPECSKLQKKWCFSKCQDAVHLFPYHLDEIMSVAKRFDPDIESYRGSLELEKAEALKRFKLAYEDHLDFVREKGIRLEDPISFEKLGVDRIKQLKKVIEEELRKEHEDVWFKGCLGEMPDSTLISFNEKAFPQILDATYKLINDTLVYNLEYQKSKGDISTNSKLLSVRTLVFSSQYVVYDEFIKSTLKSLEMLVFKSRFRTEGFLHLLLGVILKELEKGGEIAYYNPSFGYGDYATQCVFC